MEFREARPDEAHALGRMVLAGVAYWGHDENFPDAFTGLQAGGLPTSDFIRANTVEVLVDRGEVVGFFSLAVDDDFVDLVHMFLAVDRIGTGVGALLWERATDRAADLHPRMRILSDPEATGFYQAMGAELERDIEASPGFFLGLMWYDLG